MSKARVAVLKVVTKELSVTAAAAKYGYSRQHLHRLQARYRAEGSTQSTHCRDVRGPNPPHDQSRSTRSRRQAATAADQELLEAAPVTIAWHLTERGHPAPSTSTIRRLLHVATLIDPEPRTRTCSAAPAA